MVSEVDLQIERANALLERARNRTSAPSAAYTRMQIRRAKRFGAMLGGGFVALIAMALFWTILIGPIKALAILLLMVAALGVFVAATMFSREAEVRIGTIAHGSVSDMADKTERWLAQQRRALPAPAQTLTDQIGNRIANLRPQLETLDPAAPEAVELRRLVGDELPDLISKYGKVPANMRRDNRNGRVPEDELVSGLALLDGEIDTLARNLGANEMDKLSSQKRYLELRYQGDETG